MKKFFKSSLIKGSLRTRLQKTKFIKNYGNILTLPHHLSLAVESWVVLFILSLGFIGVITFANTSSGTTSLRYPLQEVSKVECRSINWTEETDDCKEALPRIVDANYAQYKGNDGYQKIYTMRWEGSYTKEGRNKEGSHPGVDIATAKGTPVYAIANATVYQAKQQAGYGNVIKIKFNYNNQTYYATYAHLSEILVKAGDTITKGQVIGKVGHSGVAGGALGGYHLHFEIDVPENDRLVYAFRECPDWQMGANEYAVVNKGLCRDYLEKRTIDPIVFLEHAGAYIKSRENIASSNDINNMGNNTKSTGNTDVVVDIPDGSTIHRSALEGNIVVNPIQTLFLSDEAKDFVKNYTFVINLETPTLKVGEKGQITISAVHKTNGTLFNGLLPEPVEIVSVSTDVSFIPSTIAMLMGKTTVYIGGTTPGTKKVVLNFAGQQLAVIEVGISGQSSVAAGGEGSPTTSVNKETTSGKYLCRYHTPEETAKYFF